MTSSISRMTIVLASVATGAATAPNVPPAARQLLAAETTHAQQLAAIWKASHPGQTSQAVSAPEIISGKIVVASVNAQQPPASPSIQFKFKTGPSGFSYADFEFFSTTTQQSVLVSYTASTALNAGSYTILSPGSVGQYAGPGTYTLAYASIGDNAGNLTQYSNAQLASFFPSLNITVTNSGTPDTTVPALRSGTIKTPSVSLSSAKPLFLASLNVSDTVSGADQALLTISDPNGAVYTAFNHAPSPIIGAGVLPIGFNLVPYPGANVPTGTWTINSVFVIDVAGNSLEVENVQSIFGTNTFQVTQ